MSEMTELPDFGAEMAKAAGKPGWRYHDLPNMLVPLYAELLTKIGDGNYQLLTEATRTWPDGVVTRRGQILISPDGIERLRAALNQQET